jgi:phytoene desaturase
MKKQKVLIIGAGIGGLATANLLAKAGLDVHIYEKDSTPGGRAGTLKINGFTFDTGPSWYLMPDVFAHYFDLLGEPIEKWLSLTKLHPAYKVFFEHNKPITITGALKKDSETFDTIEQGAGHALKAYVAQADIIYQLSMKRFLYSNFSNLSDFLKRDVIIKGPKMLSMMIRPIDSYVGSFVRDQRLKQILEYPMVFLGTSPFNAPAMYSLMSALDFKEGVYYPEGGIYVIINSLVAIGKKLGVHYHYNNPVDSITTNKSKVTGILVGKEHITADIVISNADLHYTETSLLKTEDQSYPEKYWKKKEAGPSALLMYLGVKGKLHEFEHHNLLFVDDWKENFDAIYKSRTVQNKASTYICKPSQTDSKVAPNGYENVFVLVPLPSGITLSVAEMDRYASSYLEQIEHMTHVKFIDRIVTKTLFGPDDFATKFYSWQSSMLGQSHLLRQSAFFRTPNTSKKVANLYYVGGNTTPGIGLPMCLIGAELVYKRLINDRKGGRVATIQTIKDSAR